VLTFRESLALIATLVVGTVSAPMSWAQDVIAIANVKGTQESVYFASVKGWKVVVGAINSQPAYCAAISNQSGSELRLGYDGGQWQMAVPYAAGRGEYVGQMAIDGKQTGTYGESDGNWTFLWLNLGERDALMNGQQVIIEVGKASLDYDLTGAAAAALKVEECVERRIAAIEAAADSNSSQSDTGGSGFEKPYAKVEGWEIVRVTTDAAHLKFDHCAAWKITGTETGLRIAITDNDTSFGFSGLGSAAMGDRAPLSVWFDNDKSAAESLEGRLVPDHTGFEWMMISESNDQPGLFSDAIPNAGQISFGYPVDGESHVESFSLKGTNAVVDRLINCRDGR
jgi:hypothetical protein